MYMSSHPTSFLKYTGICCCWAKILYPLGISEGTMVTRGCPETSATSGSMFRPGAPFRLDKKSRKGSQFVHNMYQNPVQNAVYLPHKCFWWKYTPTTEANPIKSKSDQYEPAKNWKIWTVGKRVSARVAYFYFGTRTTSIFQIFHHPKELHWWSLTNSVEGMRLSLLWVELQHFDAICNYNNRRVKLNQNVSSVPVQHIQNTKSKRGKHCFRNFWSNQGIFRNTACILN